MNASGGADRRATVCALVAEGRRFIAVQSSRAVHAGVIEEGLVAADKLDPADRQNGQGNAVIGRGLSIHCSIDHQYRCQRRKCRFTRKTVDRRSPRSVGQAPSLAAWGTNVCPTRIYQPNVRPLSGIEGDCSEQAALSSAPAQGRRRRHVAKHPHRTPVATGSRPRSIRRTRKRDCLDETARAAGQALVNRPDEPGSHVFDAVPDRHSVRRPRRPRSEGATGGPAAPDCRGVRRLCRRRARRRANRTVRHAGGRLDRGVQIRVVSV